jgi:hypothetical protein
MSPEQAREAVFAASGVDPLQLRQVVPRATLPAEAFPGKLPRPLAAILRMKGLPPIRLTLREDHQS